MPDDNAILRVIGSFLQKYDLSKRKKKKPPAGLESKLSQPQPKLTGEDVYQRAMKLFPDEEKQLRHSPRVESGF
jgi:hypothetical protein